MEPAPPSTLEIRLFGPFRVLVDGRPVEARRWSRRSATLLVKLLALQPHHQLHREQVMELLWPELDGHSATNNLHKSIHATRRALEPTLKSGAQSSFIITRAQQILLRAPEQLLIDVDQFEQQAKEALNCSTTEGCQKALQLYEGDLLIEDLYEDWAAARREQLRALQQDLLVRLAQLFEAGGDYQQSIERLKELLACDSANEAAHRQLMRLYAQLGSRHQALQQYQQCLEAVRRDLDSEPEPATIKLYEQIIAGRITPVAPIPNRLVATDQEPINSLAILPLVNATGNPDGEYLSDGITESIINGLSQLRQLRVLARSTVFRYKDQALDLQSVGRELGVRAVMSGRVLQVGEALIIRTELVDVNDGSQLWGEQYHRPLCDMFALQEDIAQDITEKLRLRLTGEEQQRLAKRHTENPEAYKFYLQGRYYWNKRTLEAAKKSIEYYQQAIGIDADYALAYAGLADSYTKLGDVGVTAIPPKAAFAKARAAALKALQIDPGLAESYASLAHLHMHYYEWEAAESAFKRALELNPNYATTRHWYAYYLIFNRRDEEALMQIKRALELDPLSLPINTDLGELLYFARRYAEAIAAFKKALEMDPHFFQARIALGRAYEQKGMVKEAIAEFEKARALSEDNADTLAALGHIYAVCGLRDLAVKMLAQLQELSARTYVSPYNRAIIHAGLGENDQAFALFDVEEQAEWMIYLTVDSRLDVLHSDARFQKLVERVGLKLPGASAPKEARQPLESLAILPLVNASGDADLEYLSDGITESLINNLSQLPGLKVMAWSTVCRYKDSPNSAQTIGRHLEVGTVLTGRILHLDGRLVIKVELVHVADGSQRWGGHYNRQLADIFNLEEEISNQISEQLRLKLSGEEKRRLTKRHTENTEAYHAYLKGRYYWNKRTAKWLKKGVEHFSQAIDLDPSYAAAYAGLSDSYTLLVIREALPPDDGLAKAKAAAAMALKIDNQLAEAHASLAHALLHNWEWDEAEQGFKQALALNPGYASAHHWYSEYLYVIGQLDEAIAEVKRAVELDPLSLIINAHMGDVLYYARRYEQSIEQNLKVLEMDANFAVARLDLGRAYGQIGRYEEAIIELRQATKLLQGTLERSWAIGLIYAAWGKPIEARAVLDGLKEQARQHYVSPYGMALIHTALGEPDEAFDWLEKAYAVHDGELFNIKVEPQFDRLRGDPRFADLLRRMRLIEAEEVIPSGWAMPRSVAVLPFNPISREGRDEYLEIGIADALITRLSNLSRLAVRSISSVRKYAEFEQDAVAAGRELQVEAVLEGSIQKLGERLRVTARLVAVADGRSLWADKFDEKFTDIFSVEDSISEKVAAALALKLSGNEKQRLTKRYTENIEAYRAYLRGRYYWNKRTHKDVKQGLEYFKKAIDLDPCYALAYTGLADSYLILGAFGISALSPKEAFPRAREAAIKALEVDDALAEAHASLALSLAYYYWDWPAAEREFKRALELKPGYATARHWYAFIYLTATGQLDEAIKEEQRSQALEPLSLIISTNVGTLLYLARRYDEAIEQYHKTLDMDANFIIAHWMLGLAYEQKAMLEEAITEFHLAIELSDRSALALALAGHAYAISGKRDAARAVLDELNELAKQGYVPPYRIAAIYAGLNDNEQAFAWLERAFAERDAWMIWLKVDPVLDDLRADRRFEDLLRRVG